MSETKLWYLVPLLFGLLGGIVAYIGLRDRDEGMGFWCLTLGMGISVVQAIVVLVAL